VRQSIAIEPTEKPVDAAISVPIETAVLGSLGVVVAASAALLRWFIVRLVRQTDERLTALDSRLTHVMDLLAESAKQNSATNALIGKQITDARLENASRYVSRDDYVRSQSVNEAKLDAVHRRLDEMMALIVRRGGD